MRCILRPRPDENPITRSSYDGMDGPQTAHVEGAACLLNDELNCLCSPPWKNAEQLRFFSGKNGASCLWQFLPAFLSYNPRRLEDARRSNRTAGRKLSTLVVDLLLNRSVALSISHTCWIGERKHGPNTCSVAATLLPPRTCNRR